VPGPTPTLGEVGQRAPTEPLAMGLDPTDVQLRQMAVAAEDDGSYVPGNEA
jgi:hypothetical protein